MIVDGHAHACGDFLTAEGILEALDIAGVDTVVLVPGEHASDKTYGLPNLARILPRAEVGRVTNGLTRLAVRASGARRYLDEENERVFGLSASHPDRILQFYWVLLQAGFDEAMVRHRVDEWRPRGLKVHQCWDAFSVEDDAFCRLVVFAGESALPIFIHLGQPRQATALAHLARRFPQTTFIVGHLYGLSIFMETGPAPANVYFDFSCPDIVSDFRLRRAVSYAGAERVMMGSDTPYGKRGLERSIARVRALGLPPHEEALLLGGAAKRLLRLQEAQRV